MQMAAARLECAATAPPMEPPPDNYDESARRRARMNGRRGCIGCGCGGG